MHFDFIVFPFSSVFISFFSFFRLYLVFLSFCVMMLKSKNPRVFIAKGSFHD